MPPDFFAEMPVKFSPGRDDTIPAADSPPRPARSGADSPDSAATRTSHLSIKEDHMSVVINTNYAASIAANNLNASNEQLTDSLNMLSSGSKIVNPADDPGGVAVVMKLTATEDRQAALQNNIGDATSLLQTQDGALQVAGQILDRMSQLETLYQDPTKNTSDLANYDDEFSQLNNELTSLSSETFNGVNLFGSGSITLDVTDDLSTATAVDITAANLASTTTGIGALTATTSLGAVGALADITNAIQNVGTMIAINGAEQSRLGFAGTLLTSNQTNLESAVSNINDVDVAQETTNLAKWNVLVQSGTAMLTQADQSAQIALKLITG
jgi:flagellin